MKLLLILFELTRLNNIDTNVINACINLLLQELRRNVVNILNSQRILCR